MSESEAPGIDLDDAVTGVYAGALDSFVARRDALVKDLRAAGRKDDAATVKNLRKPSRNAWALNLGVLGTPHAMATVDAALGEILAAHAGTGDVRTAMTGLRNAVRELAAHAARAAEREGLPVDAGSLSNALQTVIGSQDSLAQLRRGCLAEVPANDGLDFLATLPAPVLTPQFKPSAAPALSKPADPDADAEQARRAEAVAEARKQADAAQKAVREAEAALEAAEKMLLAAEAKAQAMRSDLEHATRRAETATENVRKAEDAAKR